MSSHVARVRDENALGRLSFFDGRNAPDGGGGGKSGCGEPGAEVRLREAITAGPDDVIAADGYIFAAPENLAALSGLMKDFFDRCYYPVLGRINGRPCGLMICAGSDGANAARQAMRIATGWRLRAVAEPLIVCTHAQTPEAILAPKVIAANDLEKCRTLGATLAAGLAMGAF